MRDDIQIIISVGPKYNDEVVKINLRMPTTFLPNLRIHLVMFLSFAQDERPVKLTAVP